MIIAGLLFLPISLIVLMIWYLYRECEDEYDKDWAVVVPLVLGIVSGIAWMATCSWIGLVPSCHC